MKRMLLAITTLALILSVSGVMAAGSGAAIFDKTCAKCHGADGSTVGKGGDHPLKGQSAEAVEQKLHGYKDGSYGGAKKVVMRNMVKRLSDEDIKAVAAHIAGL